MRSITCRTCAQVAWPAGSHWARAPMVVLAVCLVMAGLWLPASEASATAPRHALVVGISDYARADDLRHARADAHSVGARLVELGFVLHGGEVHSDVSRDALNGLMRQFASSIPDGAVALVWFSGHGVADAGQTYLVPANDAALVVRDDLATQAVALGAVVARLAGRRDVHALVVVDACRANPLSGAGGQAFGPTSDLVAPMAGSNGSVALLYSAAPGQIAADGPPGTGSSPFAAALLDALSEPARSLPAVFDAVSGSVRAQSDGFQTPWMVQAGRAHPHPFVQP